MTGTDPRRIVSLVPSWTETLFALGAGDRLVGATRYCVEPADGLAEVARVGGTKNPARQAIAALRPDLVLVNGEENRAEDIAWLGERFPLFQATPRTVEEAGAMVRALGRRVGGEDEAEAVVLRIEVEMARAAAERLTAGPVRVFYAIWPKPWMSINRDTYIHDVLTRAGAENVTADGAERYPELTLAELRALRPDVVLLPDEPYEFRDHHRQTLQDLGLFGHLPIELVCGKDFCWHGARTGAGLGRVVDLLRRFRV